MMSWASPSASLRTRTSPSEEVETRRLELVGSRPAKRALRSRRAGSLARHEKRVRLQVVIGLDQGGRTPPRFVARALPPPLGEFAELVWIDSPIEVEVAWRVVPDTSAHVIAHRMVDGSTRCALVGARSTFADIDRTDRVFTCGIRLIPGALAQLFGLSAHELTDRGLVLPDLLAPGAAGVYRRLEDADDARQVAALLSDWIGRRAQESEPIDARVREFSRRLDDGHERKVSPFGSSPRTLSWRFRRDVGVSPKRFQRIHRLHAAARAVLATSAGDADIAHRFGYHDQSHMLRDFKELLGETPVQYRRRSRIAGLYNTAANGSATPSAC